MDRGRPPRENNYRPGERYGGRSPPRRGRTPPGDRAFSARGGPPYSRGPSPGRPPPRYRSRSPYRPREGPGGAFRPRSPPRGPARPRSPPTSRRYSRSPPPRGPPPRRHSPSTYRPRSPPPRDGRFSGLPRDERREYGISRDDGPRYSRENSYRPRDGSLSPSRGSGPASKVASADSSRMPSPHVHSERLRQNLGDSPVPLGSPAPYSSRGGLSGRRSPPYRPRERSPLPPRSPRSTNRDRPPTGPRDSPRYPSPSRRDRSPPSRSNPRDRSPPKGPAGERIGFRERNLAPARDTPETTPSRSTPREEALSTWGDRLPPPGPRARDEEPRAPPSGPRSSQYDGYVREGGPPTGPSTPSGPASMNRGSAFITRGRGGTSFGRGRGETYSGSPSFSRGRGRGSYAGSPVGEATIRDASGPPTGPRNLSWAESNGGIPPSRPSLRGSHSSSSSSTYPRTQRFHVHLAGLSQIVEGGRRLSSGLNPTDEKRLAMLDSEREKLHKEIDEKQRKKRIAESEYSKAEREVRAARLRSDLAENVLERLEGEGSTATAY